MVKCLILIAINLTKEMQIQKKNLEVFFNALKGTEGVLSLSDSRIRDTFIKPLAEVTDTYIKDKTKIYTVFCTKKEDGTPDTVENEDGTTKFLFPTEKIDEINKELTVLSEEEVELKDTPGLKEILEQTTWKPKVGEVAILDEVIAKL